MKQGKILIVLLALWYIADANSFAVPNGEEAPQKETMNLITSPEMLKITKLWVENYTGSYPDTDIQIVPLPTGNLKELMSVPGTIGMVTKDELPDIRTGQSHIFTVGKDVIVPVMNTKHPYKEEILHEGISPEAFYMAFTSSGEVTWGSLLDNGSPNTVTPIISDEDAVSEYLADFLNIEASQIQNAVVNGKDEMLERIRNDRYAIGFCRLKDVTDADGQALVSGLDLVPIDMNANDTIDLFEDIYATPSDLQRGIWIGKYPKTLYSKLYAVINSHSLDQREIAFLNWVVSEGQGLLDLNDYSTITQSERYTNGEKLAGNYHVVLDVPATGSFDKTSLIVLGICLSLVCIVLIIRLLFRKREPEAGPEGQRLQSINGRTAVQVPAGLFFDKSHTWAFMEKDGKVRIGIDDFLQQITGPITRVIMKQPGEQVKKGEIFLTLVQKGKQLKIQSPVSGVVTEQNSELVSDSSSINSAPYMEGWICLVKPLDWTKELKAFVMADRYSAWIKAEFQRLKDYLSSGIFFPDRVEANPVLLDGGEIEKGFLETFGPEAWEEFQTGFISNTSNIK